MSKKELNEKALAALRQIGSSAHAKTAREYHDFYATHPIAIKYLMDGLKNVNIKLTEKILEPCIGQGHLAEALKDLGHSIIGYDIVDSGYKNTIVMDFLNYKEAITIDVVTNPPYKDVEDFLIHVLKNIQDGRIVCFFLRTLFLEGVKRKEVFKAFPPKHIIVMSRRVPCAKNGDFDNYSGSASSYSWYIWEKGFKGSTNLLWI